MGRPSSGFSGGIAFILNNKIVSGLGDVTIPVINNDSYSNFFYALDPSTGMWNTTPMYLRGDNTMPGLWGSIGISDGQTAYIGAGYKSGSGDTDKMWKYSQSSGWSSIADFPYVVQDPLAGLINGKLIVGGGEHNLGSSSTIFNTYYQYNPDENKWTSLPNGPAISGGVSIVYNNHFYVMSGYDNTAYLKSVWKYNPIRD